MASRLLENIQYFLTIAKYTLFSFTFYRAQFVLWLSAASLMTLYQFIAVTVIYSVSSGIPGWSYYQLLFLSSTASAGISIIITFVDISEISYNLNHGRYDAKLLRPYGTFTIIAGLGGFIPDISSVLGSALLMVYSLLNMSVSALSIIEFIVLLAFGLVALSMFLVMLTMFSYRYLRGNIFISEVVNFMRGVSTYPLTVYGTAGMLLFTVLLPIGTAYFYPAEVLFGSVGTLGFIAYLAGTVLVGIASYMLFYLFVKGYTGSGSAMR